MWQRVLRRLSGRDVKAKPVMKTRQWTARAIAGDCTFGYSRYRAHMSGTGALGDLGRVDKAASA